MKNRIENGLRAFLKGEKPHSKGVSFSRSLTDFSDKKIVNEIIIKEKAIDIRKQVPIINILIPSPINKRI